MYGPNQTELTHLEWLENYLDEVGGRATGWVSLAQRPDVYRRPRLHAARSLVSVGLRRARRTVGGGPRAGEPPIYQRLSGEARPATARGPDVLVLVRACGHTADRREQTTVVIPARWLRRLHN